MFRSAQHDSTSFRARLLKQLEFAFQKSTTHLRAGRDVDLESKARQLLRQLGAHKLAREVRVEWNPRMRTAAGRANFREKLISLNPLLLDLHAREHALARIQFGTRELECNKHSNLTNSPEIRTITTELEC